jgi:hypothetical protein
LLKASAAAPLLVSLAIACALGLSARRVTFRPAAPMRSNPEWAAFAPPPALEQAPWEVLVPGSDTALAEGALARRFRLAGTLFGFGVGSAEAPQAILDDKLLVVQRLVRRGQEILPGIRLTQVRSDAVVVEGPQGQEELRLERTAYSAAPSTGAAPSAVGGTAKEGVPGQKDFGGGQVFPGRWEFQRDALLGYYAELRNEPERLLAVFDSMEPLYQDDNPATRNITGYRLNVRGEAPLFDAMGLNPGDIVRSVNSVPMTNRRRAEDFIRSFVENQEDTFVFEVERNGASSKQVYIIR